MNSLELAKHVFNKEIDALYLMRDNLNDTFIHILDLLTKCTGKVIFIGIGKSGHICRKLASTFSSLGTPSFFLHPAEAQHGDLGMISQSDVVIIISYSGESDEIINLLYNIRFIGSKIVAVTSNKNSTLAKNCDVLQVIPQVEEACFMNLAPTSSTAVQMVYGDALAIAASCIYGFNKNNFALFHPAGSLGKKLILKVKDIMVSDKYNSFVYKNSIIQDAIIEMTDKHLGLVNIIDNENKLVGIITDGDIRRYLAKCIDIYKVKVNEIMTKTPISVTPDEMAIDALNKMREKNIGCLSVIDKNNILVGSITIHMLLQKGFYN